MMMVSNIILKDPQANGISECHSECPDVSTIYKPREKCYIKW